MLLKVCGTPPIIFVHETSAKTQCPLNTHHKLNWRETLEVASVQFRWNMCSGNREHPSVVLSECAKSKTESIASLRTIIDGQPLKPQTRPKMASLCLIFTRLEPGLSIYRTRLHGYHLRHGSRLESMSITRSRTIASTTLDEHLNPFPAAIRTARSLVSSTFRDSAKTTTMTQILIQSATLKKELVVYTPSYHNHQMGCALPYQDTYQQTLFRKFQEYFGQAATDRFEQAIVRGLSAFCHFPNLTKPAPIVDDTLPRQRGDSLCDGCQLPGSVGLSQAKRWYAQRRTF